MQTTSGGYDLPQLIAGLLNPASYQYSPLAYYHFGAALLVGVCGGLVMYWERGSRVSRLFAAFTALFTLWATGRGVLRLLVDPQLVTLLGRRMYVLIMLCMPMLFHFAMVLLRADNARRVQIRAHWTIGILVGL